MSDAQDGPWNDYAAPTAMPPSSASSDSPPWEDFAASPPQTGMFGQTLKPGTTAPATAFQQDVQGPGLQDATIPDGLALYGAAGIAKTGASIAAAGASAAKNGIASIFEAPESLKSAGITARTLENMAPGNQNPADYTAAVEKQLQGNGALGNTAKETWDKMNTLKDAAGLGVQSAFSAIKNSASPSALMADAQSALQPLVDEWTKRASGLVPDMSAAKPFEEYANALGKIAQSQGGKLTLDNIDQALKEVGTKLDESSQDMEPVFSKLYGKLADARDSIVNTIANQAGDPALKTNLLKNNADYSTYMRLLPSIEKNAYKEAIKEGVSAYQKYGGPIITKVAAASEVAHLLHEAINKVLGSD